MAKEPDRCPCSECAAPGDELKDPDEMSLFDVIRMLMRVRREHG